jgi:hypothetical protein
MVGVGVVVSGTPRRRLQADRSQKGCLQSGPSSGARPGDSGCEKNECPEL